MAPERVAALVLIRTKARHRPDPALYSAALKLIREERLEVAWKALSSSLSLKSHARVNLGIFEEDLSNADEG
jgi:hypothetical protein